MTSTLLLDKDEKAKIFRITNDSDEKIAVQISLAKRIMDETGNEKNPEVEDFLIFPSQLILPPKSKRSVKLQWLNKKNISDEQAYRIIAEQLPVDLVHQKAKKNKANLKILLKYVGALYVSKTEYASKITLKSSKKITDGKNHKLEITIENEGLAHHILANLHLELEQANQKLKLKSEQQLKGLLGENILAHKNRKFILPWPKELNPEKDFKLKLIMEGS